MPKTLALALQETQDKSEIFAIVKQYLARHSHSYVAVDAERPWGGFFVIDESQTAEFISHHFPELSPESIGHGSKLSPKILVVEPGKRLSWQYHDRRGELWKVVIGPVGVITSETDVHGDTTTVNAGETIQFGTQVRHRLVGHDGWGIVAEIWLHTDHSNPSNEDDIIRIEDDFGR